MSKKNYPTYQADPESTVGLAITNGIEMAKIQDKKVIVHLRNTACTVTKNTKLSEAVERYRRTVERFARVRG